MLQRDDVLADVPVDRLPARPDRQRLGVLIHPRMAPDVVAGGVGGNSANEIIVIIARDGGGGQDFWDISLRHFGLKITGVALAHLQTTHIPRHLSAANPS